MTFQELLNDEREAGRKEGHAAGLEEGLAEGHATGLKEGLAEGHAAGLKEGRIESLKNLVKKKLEKGKSVEAIAEDLEEDITVIRELMEQLKEE